MCGIAGYIGRKKLSSAILEGALDALHNRGPDCAQGYSFESDRLNVYLLHTRLSIVDLDSRSNQPFRCGHLALVYNGEIYNFVELRAELERSGEEFLTSSDTEVLVRGLCREGTKFLDKCEGMWSFALFDERTQQLLLSRDRFGEKPLLTCRTSDGIFFASEVNALKSLAEGVEFTVNNEKVSRALRFGFRSLFSDNETFYEEIRHLPSATNLTVDSSLKSVSERYWTPSKPHGLVTSPVLAAEQARELLIRSMGLRMRSDVPIAFCLSGGVDSGALISIASKVLGARAKSFSIIDTDSRYDESDMIAQTVLDTSCENVAIPVSRTGFLERMRQLIRYRGAPVSTISYYVHSMLSQAIHDGGYRVVISGTGADELFGGYYDHFLLQLAELRGTPHYDHYLAAWQHHIAPLIRSPQLRDVERFVGSPGDRSYLTDAPAGIVKCLTHTSIWSAIDFDCHGTPLKDRLLSEMFREIVPVILWEDDLNSMLFSIENRSPFLDRAIFDFCQSLDPSILIQDAVTKNVLREAMKGILNEPVRTQRQKKGFNASINSLLDLESSETREELLADSPIWDFVHKDSFATLLKPNTSNEESKFIFNVISAKCFLES